MKIHSSLTIATLTLLSALASCAGDEKPTTTASNTAPSRPEAGTPPADASTRKPSAPETPPPPLDPPPKPAVTDPPAAQPTDPPVAAEPPVPAPAPAEEEPPLLGPEDAAIPTQEEADLDATQNIREDNADEELEKLEKELETPGGG
jgi:hypothetical protein